MSLSLSSCCFPALAGVFACGLVAAEAAEPVLPVIEPVAAPVAVSRPVTTPGRPGGAEFSIGLRSGRGSVADSEVSASIGCLVFCYVVTETRTVHFSDIKTVGLRTDLWGGGRWINAGFGLEMATSSTKADHVSLRYNTTSFFPMVRLPLWRDAAMPGGHVNLYGGMMVTRAWGGDMEVSFPGLPRPVSGVVTGRGNGAFAGVALKYGHALLSLEYRDTDIKLNMKEYYDYGSTRMDGQETQLGLSYLY